MTTEFKMKTYRPIVNIQHLFVLIFVFLFPSLGFAQEATAATQLDLKHHFVGYLAVAITVIAYAIAMTEDLHQMSKAKPMVLGSALIWLAIFIYYAAVYGTAKNVAPVFQSNLTAYAELFLFITVSMTFLNAMTERGIFDALRIVFRVRIEGESAPYALDNLSLTNSNNEELNTGYGTYREDDNPTVTVLDMIPAYPLTDKKLDGQLSFSITPVDTTKPPVRFHFNLDLPIHPANTYNFNEDGLSFSTPEGNENTKLERARRCQ